MSESRTRKVKKKWGKVWESTVIERAGTLTEDKAEEVAKYIDSQKVITPEELANRQAIRVSLARKILSGYAEEGKLKLSFKNGQSEIYSQ